MLDNFARFIMWLRRESISPAAEHYALLVSGAIMGQLRARSAASVQDITDQDVTNAYRAECDRLGYPPMPVERFLTIADQLRWYFARQAQSV